MQTIPLSNEYVEGYFDEGTQILLFNEEPVAIRLDSRILIVNDIDADKVFYILNWKNLSNLIRISSITANTLFHNITNQFNFKN